jgi:hypothetical protein
MASPSDVDSVNRSSSADRSDDGMPFPANPNDASNRRGSFRCSVHGEQQRAALVAGRSRYRVRLVDRSAGGYGVLYSGDATFKVGQVLRLHTLAGIAEVSIVSVTPSEDAWRIGLVHIDCVEPTATIPASVAWFLIIAITTVAVYFFVR